MKWFYDDVTGRYYVEKARISFANFSGSENDYNRAGSKNFKLKLDEKLYNELTKPRDDGSYVKASMKPARTEEEEPYYSVKVGVYPATDVYCLTGKHKRLLDFEDLSLIDRSISKGQVANGQIDLSFHVSVNTKLSGSKTVLYLRADEIYIPINESRFASKYEHYGEDDEDETPFD